MASPDFYESTQLSLYHKTSSPERLREKHRPSLIRRVSDLLSFWFTQLFDSEMCDTNAHGPLSSSNTAHSQTRLSRSIESFLITTCSVAEITESELLYAVVLIEDLVRQQINPSTSKPPLIFRENLGTLILVSIILSLKFLRDRTYKNSCWAKLHSMDLKDLNKSERIFCQYLNHHILVGEERILRIMKKIS
ncbi:hypothetical protein BLNAU_3888 [Blattamonas nauphoetae]|uniref:Cyclin N-terminal domain-containing protein n=1 Tax=Blattamonas nauphoetae TaxID=2049346 RepID=A0ABQ9YBI2_9EUKA|nr:hypothetical protein BLNAU_3888 [Blattamonas nauphoetae]